MDCKLKRLAIETLKFLKWLDSSHGSDFHQFLKVLAEYCDYIKLMYLEGGDELVPEGFSELFAFKSSADETSLMTLGDVIKEKYSQDCIEGTLKCLTEKWRGPFMVTLNIEVCRLHMNSLTDAINKPDKLKTCLKIFNSIRHTVNGSLIASSCKNQDETSTTLLCLNQVKNNLPLFLIGLEEDCYLVQNHASNCLMECLDAMRKETCEPTPLACSEFIDLMDSALNLLDDLIENTREWMLDFKDRVKTLKEIIDELLCHSMSTAQVAATNDDKQTILIKSQMILKNMETLKDNLTGDDMSCVILEAHTVSDALCELERAVNSAVLRLVLQINSGLEDPLRELIDRGRVDSELSVSEGSRKASDLDEGTLKFDSYMDKLMQIGTFAVSCSSNTKKAMQIRSCLASFESLEAELIPCVTAIYLERNRSNKKNLRIFLEHWLKEFKEFRAVLDTIVDPAAFIEVVRDTLNEIARNLETSDDHLGNLRKMIKVANTLDGILATSIHQDCAENVSEMTMLVGKVTKSIENCGRVCHKLQIPDSHVPVNVVNKKAQQLIESVNSVWDYLARQIVEADSTNLDREQFLNPKLLQRAQKSYYQLCPTDCETPIEMDSLKPLQARGSLLRKEAILYNTPKRSTVIKPTIRATPVVLSTIRKNRLASVTRSRCFRSTVKTKSDKELTDMELTALLEDLSKLDSTFFLNETIKQKKADKFHGRKLLDLFTGWDSLLEQTPQLETTKNESRTNSELPGSTIGSSDTPQRFSDLLMVDQKIEQLKQLKLN